MGAIKSSDQIVKVLVSSALFRRAHQPSTVAHVVGSFGIFISTEDLFDAGAPFAKVRREPWGIAILIPVFPSVLGGHEPQGKLTVGVFGVKVPLEAEELTGDISPSFLESFITVVGCFQ